MRGTKLEEILRAKGIKLFALIGHDGEAARAGLRMRPAKLLIFGNPKASWAQRRPAQSICRSGSRGG